MKSNARNTACCDMFRFSYALVCVWLARSRCLYTYPPDIRYESVDGEWGEHIQVASFERFTRDEVCVHIIQICLVNFLG